MREEIKPVASEKDKFQDREKSKLLAFFGFFGLTKIKTHPTEVKGFQCTDLAQLLSCRLRP